MNLRSDSEVRLECFSQLEGNSYTLAISTSTIDLQISIAGISKISELANFISTTRRNQTFRDPEISPGVFKAIPPCFVEVGYFGNLKMILIKDGEFDDRYFLKAFDHPTHSLLMIPLSEAILSNFVSGLNQLLSADLDSINPVDWDASEYSIYFAFDNWADDDPKGPEDNNSDVIVTFNNGERWIATFYSIQNVQKLMTLYESTGECLSGLYFWANDMIFVKELSRELVSRVIFHLIQSHEFKQSFRRIS